MDQGTTDPSVAMDQMLAWAWAGSGPDIDTVMATSAEAFPALWNVQACDGALVVLGELRRYALSSEPMPDSAGLWRAKWREDGLEDIFYPPHLAFLDSPEFPRFTFEFVQNDLLHSGLHIGRANMKESFLQELPWDPEEADVDGAGVPMPGVDGNAPACVKTLHKAIEEFYNATVALFAGREIVEADERIETASESILGAIGKLQVLLELAHRPIYVGLFCQALRDSFEPFHVDTEEDLEEMIGPDYGNAVGVPDHYDDVFYWQQLRRVGIPYFREAIGLMARCWPYIDPYDEIYAPAKLAHHLTSMTLVELNRLSKPGGPVRSKRPSRNRRLIHLGDLARYIEERDGMGE